MVDHGRGTFGWPVDIASMNSATSSKAATMYRGTFCMDVVDGSSLCVDANTSQHRQFATQREAGETRSLGFRS